MKTYGRRLVLLFAAVLFTCALTACSGDDGDPSTLETYKFDRDKVPSITSVVGQRTVTNVETEGENEFPSQRYTYESDSVTDDLSQYIELLEDEGWIMTEAGFHPEETPGTVQLAKESADDGHILDIYIDYEEDWYAVRVVKVEAVMLY